MIETHPTNCHDASDFGPCVTFIIYHDMFSNSAIHSDPFCSIFCNSKPHNALPKNWPCNSGLDRLAPVDEQKSSKSGPGIWGMILVKPTSLHRTICDQATHPFQPHQHPAGAMAHTSDFGLWKWRISPTAHGHLRENQWKNISSYPVAKGLRVFFCSCHQWFLQLFLGKVFFAWVGAGVFCFGWRVFLATADGVFCDGDVVFCDCHGVFCDGNQCFLRWLRGGGL